MEKGLLDQISQQAPTPSLSITNSRFAGERLSLLIIARDSHLADLCVSLLQGVGYDVAADIIPTTRRFRETLQSKSYDAILHELGRRAARDPTVWEELEKEGASIPVIILGRRLGAQESRDLLEKGAADFVATEHMVRLPWVMRRVIEFRRLRDGMARAEEGRRRAEERYRLLFDRNLAGVYRASLDGRILDLNETCARMFGYLSAKKAQRHTLQETVPSPEDYEHLMRSLREQKYINNLELQLRRRDGQLRWVLLTASLIETSQDSQPMIEGTIIDVTDWKRAEDALRQSEKRFRALVEKSTDGISLVDATGKVLYSSHAVSPIFGYQLEERLGKNIFELMHPEDLQRALPLFKKLVEKQLSTVTVEVRYRHKDGSWRWIEALGTNLLEDPNVGAVVINYRDVTERRQLQEQLFQAQKMEAVGRLAGGVAHDFNNLLTAILGYSDIVMEKLEPSSPLHRYTQEIKKAGERAASLTRQLLAFSRLQVMSPQVLDLNTVISDLGKMLRRVIGEDIQLTIAPEAKRGRVRADPAQIEQVVLNLAFNARDAMPQGGKLTLKVSDENLKEGFVVEGVKVTPGPYVSLEVTDTGCGMDQETRVRAFEPFFTTKEKGKGTGLGLSTVYGIVKQSGGYIWLTSEPGHGATFKIYLPGVEEAVTPVQLAQAPVRRHQGTETILIVEDEDAVRTLVCRLLKSQGYQVLEATRGDEALALCHRHKLPIHLALMDIIMPQSNGQELSRRIRALHPETRILFMTGYAGNKMGNIDVLEKGAQFILKPFTADALSQKIRSALDAR